MVCNCDIRMDCPCDKPDPDPDLDEGELCCANCFAIIGTICDDCCEALKSKME